jgi:hypothetical protein
MAEFILLLSDHYDSETERADFYPLICKFLDFFPDGREIAITRPSSLTVASSFFGASVILLLMKLGLKKVTPSARISH